MSNTFEVRETVHSWQPEQIESFGSRKKICCRCLCILPDVHVVTETIRPYNLLTNTGPSSQQPLHFITAFRQSERICADALRECAFSPRVKGPHVFWPASGPVNTFQWLTADRWSAEAAGGPWWDGRWESALYVDITATYVLKKNKKEMIRIQVNLCHGTLWILKSFSERLRQRGQTDKGKEWKWLKSLMRARLPVWESLVLLGPDSRGGVATKEGPTRVLTALQPTLREISASARFPSGSDTEWWITHFYKTRGR